MIIKKYIHFALLSILVFALSIITASSFLNTGNKVAPVKNIAFAANDPFSGSCRICVIQNDNLDSGNKTCDASGTKDGDNNCLITETCTPTSGCIPILCGGGSSASNPIGGVYVSTPTANWSIIKNTTSGGVITTNYNSGSISIYRNECACPPGQTPIQIGSSWSCKPPCPTLNGTGNRDINGQCICNAGYNYNSGANSCDPAPVACTCPVPYSGSYNLPAGQTCGSNATSLQTSCYVIQYCPSPKVYINATNQNYYTTYYPDSTGNNATQCINPPICTCLGAAIAINPIAGQPKNYNYTQPTFYMGGVPQNGCPTSGRDTQLQSYGYSSAYYPQYYYSTYCRNPQTCICPTGQHQVGNVSSNSYQTTDATCNSTNIAANCTSNTCTNSATNYPYCTLSCPCPNGAPNFTGPVDVACPTAGQPGYNCPSPTQVCQCPTGQNQIGNKLSNSYTAAICNAASVSANCEPNSCANGAPLSTFPACIASCPCPNGAPNFNSPPGAACPTVGQAGYFCPNLAQYCPCPTGTFAVDGSGNYTQSGFVVPDQVSCTPAAKSANCRAQTCPNGAPVSTYPLCINSCPCPNGANPYTSPAGGNCAAVSEITCPSCAPGSYRQPDGSCSACVGNTILNNASTACIACPAGTIANINHTSCSPCTGNTIANPTLARCDACPAGTIPNTAHTACGICDGIPSNGIPDCNQNCSFNGGEGKPLCKVCEPGVGGVLPAGCVVCAETPTAPTPACGAGVCDVIPTDNGVFQCPATPACNNVAGDGIPDCVQVCDYIFGNAVPDCKVCDTIVGNNIPDCNCTENPDAGIALCGPGVCDNDIPKDNSIKQCPALTCSTDPSVDTDGDGIKDVLEAAGPNSGDGNGDGIPDCLQNTVATTPTGVGTKYVSIIAKGNSAGLCKAITGASVTTESDNSKQDSSYEYPFGFVNYSVACATTSDIALNWFTGGDNGEVLRGFNPLTPGTASTADYYDQTLTSRQIVSVGSASALQTLFTLTDGQLGDASGVDNSITNRSGLGAKIAVKPPAPIIITGGSSLSLLFTLSAFIVSIIAVYAIYLRRAGEWNYATIRSSGSAVGRLSSIRQSSMLKRKK